MPEFTPKKYKFTATTIRIEASRLDLIDKIALKYNMSRNEFLNQCIYFALLHMRDDTEKEYFIPKKFI